MPSRTNDFQRLISFLEGQLAPTGATIASSAMLSPTNGGGPREVDILIEHKVGPHPVRLAIECRAHTRPQGLEWIDALAGKYEHLPVHKLVAVSKSGFTKSAQDAAAHLNIATVTLRQALASDWPGEVARYRVGLIAWDHPLRAAEVNYTDGPKIGDLTPAELLVAGIEDKDGHRLGTFTDDVKYLSTSFVGAEMRKWAQENAKTIFSEKPGHVWHLRLSYSAHNRFLVPPRGPRRQINEVILCLECSYRFEAADLSYFRYHGALVASGTLEPPGHPSKYTFALLFGPTGEPAAMNLHREPKALPPGSAV